MTKLLVLGSNFGSVEIVKRAKERGIYTIVSDYYDCSRSNAKLYCDECWDISITETNLLAQKCREEKIDAVTCGVSEFSSEMTFKLCDELGFPKYCTWESWTYARNKRRFKDICMECGVPVAEDYFITDPYSEEQTKKIQFPAVVKPIDCGGNAGVSFCNDVYDLQKAFKKAREVSDIKDTIICERFLQGKEYAAAYALAEGEASLIDFFAMHNQDGEPINCYILDVTVTGLLQQYLKEIDSNIKKVFKKAGFTEGFVWIEVMTDINGHMYVLEPGYRFPGGMIAYTFTDACGFNAIDWYLDCFLGIRHTKSELPVPQFKEYTRYGVSYLIWNKQGGVIRDVRGLEVVESKLKNNESLIIDFIRKPGYKLHEYSLMGEILFTAATKDEVIKIIELINNNVSVITEDNIDVMIKFKDFNKIWNVDAATREVFF